jgi:hypothetical protein
MLYIYSSPENTRRLDYIARHIFNNLLGTDFVIMSDRNCFLQQSGACINYSNEEMNRSLQIIPQGLLAEKGVRTIDNLQESEWKGLLCFFKQTNGDIPFDIFAASFYLLTLYEEYIPARLDEHGRFHHEASLIYRKGFLETPLIDCWAYLLKAELEGKGFDTSSFQLRKYRVVSTFDIDHPFLYRNKGWIKNAGGAARDLLQGHIKNIGKRLAVQLHLKPDPYFQAIRWIDSIQKQFNRSYYLFVLIAGKSPYDRKTVYSHRRFYQYLKQLQTVHIGLHPSYLTLRNLKRLMKEKSKLEHIVGNKVILNRQHFLRMQNPETFQELDLAGFKEDFTLAFAHAPGFRSGTAVPYFFYDMEREVETELLIRPTILMDSTFIFHQKLKPEEALQKIKRLIDACKQSGGDYVSLWHNSNLAGTEKENPWINVFIRSQEYAISLENS